MTWTNNNITEGPTEGKNLLLSSHPDICPPDPKYFQLHAALARVLHASGRAEELDDAVRNLEENGVVAGEQEDIGVRLGRKVFEMVEDEEWGFNELCDDDNDEAVDVV